MNKVKRYWAVPHPHVYGCYSYISGQKNSAKNFATGAGFSETDLIELVDVASYDAAITEVDRLEHKVALLRTLNLAKELKVRDERAYHMQTIQGVRDLLDKALPTDAPNARSEG